MRARSRRSGKQRAHPARQPIRDAKPPLGHRQQHHAAVRSQTPTVESGGDFLRPNGWKRERQKIIIGHGERGVAREQSGSV
jgi:hypothetical protein